jgi:NADH dehydrogenase FAD-containing subunit
VKILHILNDGPEASAERIINVQAKEHEVKVIDLSEKEISYENIIDDIFSYDRVISW